MWPGDHHPQNTYPPDSPGLLPKCPSLNFSHYLWTVSRLPLRTVHMRSRARPGWQAVSPQKPLEHTPGIPKSKEFLSKVLVGGLGYVWGVCWKILRTLNLEDFCWTLSHENPNDQMFVGLTPTISYSQQSTHKKYCPKNSLWDSTKLSASYCWCKQNLSQSGWIQQKTFKNTWILAEPFLLLNLVGGWATHLNKISSSILDHFPK